MPADLEADQVRTLYQQTPITLVGNALGLALIGSMFEGLAPSSTLGAWVLGVGLLIAWRGWLLLRFPAKAGRSVGALLEWRRRWNRLALASAAGWSLSVWLFYGLGSTFHFVALILIVYGYMLAGVQLLATQRRVYLAFICIGMLPIALRVALDRTDAYHLALAGIMVLLLLITVGMAAVYRRAFESTIRLKVRTEQLVAQLRQEKSEADAARHAAEVANRSKTQFFAAASHDLRQPLHALGLFAEALRGRSHDEDAVGLVTSINSSVDALEGLFSELLDITRIDSGGVEPQPRSFAAGELFGRLKLHFEPTAFEKGLALRFRGGHRRLWGDPLVIERIVRNLLANAIRYSDDGGVLVACREHGERLSLQVWDTGIGIAPHEQERIFEEFYQVADRRRLEAHERKGLGLGLAIVKRLAALIGAPLTMRSVHGRGTMFALEIPHGDAGHVEPPARAPKPPIGLTLETRVIVVIEDDPAVRSGLEVVLKSWGAAVIAFGTVSACRAWADAAPADALRPDLLIVDYRLEDGATGVEAIAAMRLRFGAELPAIVITGSTMAAHEVDAQAHDFHLLVKPVVPNKLRAMIAFKLKGR